MVPHHLASKTPIHSVRFGGYKKAYLSHMNFTGLLQSRLTII